MDKIAEKAPDRLTIVNTILNNEEFRNKVAGMSMNQLKKFAENANLELKIAIELQRFAIRQIKLERKPHGITDRDRKEAIISTIGKHMQFTDKDIDYVKYNPSSRSRSNIWWNH